MLCWSIQLRYKWWVAPQSLSARLQPEEKNGLAICISMKSGEPYFSSKSHTNCGRLNLAFVYEKIWPSNLSQALFPHRRETIPGVGWDNAFPSCIWLGDPWEKVPSSAFYFQKCKFAIWIGISFWGCKTAVRCFLSERFSGFILKSIVHVKKA